MASIVSSTPQKIVNRKGFSDSTLDSSECLDLSLKEFHVIIYYPDSDPGNEYEILGEKDLEDSWDILEKGAVVFVKFGNAKVQGTVVTISDDLSYLKTHFQAVTEEHQEQLLEEQLKGKKQLGLQQNRSAYVRRRHIIKVMDKETQTEQPPPETPMSSNTDYVELKRKYEELKHEFDKFTSMFSEIKSGLEETMMKMENFKVSDDKRDFSTTSASTLLRNSVFKPIVDNKENVDCFNQMIQIGSGGTKIPRNIYDSINWTSYTAATRKLLITLFPRKVLATHSLTGKPSPAFLTNDKQVKMRLNPAIISDIVELISRNCKVSKSLVRNAITTKCADENKLYRKRMQKKRSSDAENDVAEDRKCKK